MDKAEAKARALSDFAAHVGPMKARILASAGLDVLEQRREGARVWDLTGESYLDCVTSAGSFNAGRRHPKLVAALQQAVETYDLGNFLLCSQPKAELAKRLAELAPGDLSHTMFGASGGEVVDFAMKLARGCTGRAKIISTDGAYHGHTGFALSAIGRESYRAPFGPLMPGFARVSYGDLTALEAAIDPDTAAVILEPIQGEGGIHVPPTGYLTAVRRLCDEHGALLILDEIQTGLGRTGKLFACEHEGVIPDIMVLGKSLGGGLYPISAAMFRAPLADFLVAHPFVHLSTFGGADLGCKVALAMLDVVLEERLPERAMLMGQRLAAGFDRLAERHPLVLASHRGIGLMRGLQFTESSLGPRMSYQLARRGVIAIYTGNDPSVMRIQPPLTISANEVDELLAALDGAMAAVTAQLTEPASGVDDTGGPRPKRRPTNSRR